MTERKNPHTDKRTLLAVGDINPCRHLAQALLQTNLADKCASLNDILKGGDLVIGNLEGPITEDTRKTPGQVWNLNMPPSLRCLLTSFSGLSLANNHMFDFGLSGLMDTFENLDAMGIAYCGAGRDAAEAARPATFDINGFSVSMMGMTDRNWHPSHVSRPGTHIWRSDETAAAIKRLRQTTDFVIVHIHQGYEFLNYPGPEEMVAAKQAIDAGADLVLGHHSHYLMGVTRRGRGAIGYGLGDFLLDKQHIPAPYRETARFGAVFKFEISKHQVLDWSIAPLRTDAYGWPSPARGAEADAITSQFERLSGILEDETETLKQFRRQAADNMLPYALDLLRYLFTQKGLKAALFRLRRVRRVDIHIMWHYLWQRIQGAYM